MSRKDKAAELPLSPVSKKKKKGVFYSNRFTAIFSLVVATLVWLFVAIQFSPQETRTIENVPVTVDMTSGALAKLNLRIFGQKDFTVDVTVTGKRYEISSASLSADDISAVAQTSYVDAAGKHKLMLKVTPKDSSANYVITDYSEDYVEVYFDENKQVRLDLTPYVITGKLVPDGYVSDAPLLSAVSVNVTGPKTEVDKISTVAARVKIDEPITSTTTLPVDVIPLNDQNGVLRYLTVDTGGSEVTMTIPVYKVIDVDAVVTFTKAPSAYELAPLPYIVDPSAITIGVAQSAAAVTRSVSIAQIDFTDISAGVSTFEIAAADVPDVKFVGEYDKIIVTVDASAMSEKTVVLSPNNIRLLNLSDGRSAGLPSDGVKVTVVGPEASLEKITSASLTAALDLADMNQTPGELIIKGGLYIEGVQDCWIKTGYTLPITIS